MPKITITFQHLYALVNAHQMPVSATSIGAKRQLIHRDLADLGFIEDREGRWFMTAEGDVLVGGMGQLLRQEADRKETK